MHPCKLLCEGAGQDACSGEDPSEGPRQPSPHRLRSLQVSPQSGNSVFWRTYLFISSFWRRCWTSRRWRHCSTLLTCSRCVSSRSSGSRFTHRWTRQSRQSLSILNTGRPGDQCRRLWRCDQEVCLPRHLHHLPGQCYHDQDHHQHSITSSVSFETKCSLPSDNWGICAERTPGPGSRKCCWHLDRDVRVEGLLNTSCSAAGFHCFS